MTRAVWLLALTAACSRGVSPRVHQARLDALDSLEVIYERGGPDAPSQIESWWRRHEGHVVAAWPEYQAALAKRPFPRYEPDTTGAGDSTNGRQRSLGR